LVFTRRLEALARLVERLAELPGLARDEGGVVLVAGDADQKPLLGFFVPVRLGVVGADGVEVLPLLVGEDRRGSLVRDPFRRGVLLLRR
jgi:hypothetical protein